MMVISCQFTISYSPALSSQPSHKFSQAFIYHFFKARKSSYLISLYNNQLYELKNIYNRLNMCFYSSLIEILKVSFEIPVHFFRPVHQFIVFNVFIGYTNSQLSTTIFLIIKQSIWRLLIYYSTAFD